MRCFVASIWFVFAQHVGASRPQLEESVIASSPYYMHLSPVEKQLSMDSQNVVADVVNSLLRRSQQRSESDYLLNRTSFVVQESSFNPGNQTVTLRFFGVAAQLTPVVPMGPNHHAASVEISRSRQTKWNHLVTDALTEIPILGGIRSHDDASRQLEGLRAIQVVPLNPQPPESPSTFAPTTRLLEPVNTKLSQLDYGLMAASAVLFLLILFILYQYYLETRIKEEVLPEKNPTTVVRNIDSTTRKPYETAITVSEPKECSPVPKVQIESLQPVIEEQEGEEEAIEVTRDCAFGESLTAMADMISSAILNDSPTSSKQDLKRRKAEEESTTRSTSDSLMVQFAGLNFRGSKEEVAVDPDQIELGSQSSAEISEWLNAVQGSGLDNPNKDKKREDDSVSETSFSYLSSVQASQFQS